MSLERVVDVSPEEVSVVSWNRAGENVMLVDYLARFRVVNELLLPCDTFIATFDMKPFTVIGVMRPLMSNVGEATVALFVESWPEMTAMV